MARWDKRPEAFSFKPKDENEYRIIEDNMTLGCWKSFSEMNREAIRALNEKLTRGATA